MDQNQVTLMLMDDNLDHSIEQQPFLHHHCQQNAEPISESRRECNKYNPPKQTPGKVSKLLSVDRNKKNNRISDIVC